MRSSGGYHGATGHVRARRGHDGVTEYFQSYGTLGALTLLGLVFVAVGLGANRAMRPVRPRPDKYTTYECGVDPVGEGWSQTQIRYYIFAFLFVIFDVEALFLFPFATIFEDFVNPGLVLVEMIVFVGILAVALLYAWRKKVLEWI